MANDFHDTLFTDSQLEEIFLFWVCAERFNFLDLGINLKLFLSKWNEKGKLSPFKTIRNMVDKVNLPLEIKNCGIQDYNDKAIIFIMVAFSDIDLRTCAKEDLMKIKGMKRQSINCFFAHTRIHSFNKKTDNSYIQNEYEKLFNQSPNKDSKKNEVNDIEHDLVEIDMDLLNLFRKSKQ